MCASHSSALRCPLIYAPQDANSVRAVGVGRAKVTAVELTNYGLGPSVRSNIRPYLKTSAAR